MPMKRPIPARPVLLALALALAVGLSATAAATAAAAETAEQAVRYRVPMGCPPRERFVAEVLARREMSDADREQLGRAVDVIYETVREGVCASRGITTDAFDRITYLRLSSDGLFPPESWKRNISDRSYRFHLRIRLPPSSVYISDQGT